MLPEASIVRQAIEFATAAHSAHVRKYTGEPYICHLAQTAGFVGAVANDPVTIATAWLHDTVEMGAATARELEASFGLAITTNVLALTPIKHVAMRRREAKALEAQCLGQAPPAAQTVKCADILSNVATIYQFDPAFPRVYLAEKSAAIAHMSLGDPTLRQMARNLIQRQFANIALEC